MDGDLGDRHSSLIGWAYDGNPIYGPVGYLNGVDESAGVIQLASGWVLNVDRSGITPMNQVAVSLPTTHLVPMTTQWVPSSRTIASTPRTFLLLVV